MKENIEKFLFGTMRKMVKEVPLNKKTGIADMVKYDMENFTEMPDYLEEVDDR